MSESVMAGGWTEFSVEIDDNARTVFDIALHGLTGVGYTPVAVATQVVAGENYQFFCNAKAVYPGAANQAAMVHIYQPLKGKPHITAITSIN